MPSHKKLSDYAKMLFDIALQVLTRHNCDRTSLEIESQYCRSSWSLWSELGVFSPKAL